MAKDSLLIESSIEAVAKCISEDISRQYLDSRKIVARFACKDDCYMETTLKEAKKLKISAYNYVTTILTNSKEQKKFLRKKLFFFKDSHVLSITVSSSFYKDLLPHRDISCFFSNIEYVIDMHDITRIRVTKYVHSSYTIL